MKINFYSKIIFSLAFAMLSHRYAYCQIPTTWGNQTIAAGSKIIDMGVSPQTISNGIKPYGLLYDLLKNYNIPVLWAINPNKTKDGIDFIQDGITYKGGPFIIEAAYLSSTVNTVLSNWISKGVVIRTTTTAGSIPIFRQFNAAPNWTIDQGNPNIAIGFLTDALIPSTAYSTKNPSELNSCDNLFIEPHSDPTWASHGRVYSWVKPLDSANGCRGWYWGGCHAVSVLENLYNPAATWQKMNFLSATGLVDYHSHHDGTTPYINDSFPAHPFMQWLGAIDAATNNGSEKIYLPSLGGGWRPNTKLGVYDPTQQDIPSLSPGKAALLAFGPAFNNNNGGYVMYEGGHDVSGNAAANVAAERAFFNFCFLAPAMQPQSVIDSLNIPDTLYAGNTLALSITVSGNGAPYTYLWSTTCSGAAISNPTSRTTNITIPPSGAGPGTISIQVTNACGKVIFRNKSITVKPIIVLPLQLVNYGLIYWDHMAKLSWEVTNEAGGKNYIIERSVDGRTFAPVGSVLHDVHGSGIYNFDDSAVDQLRSENIYYRVRLVMKDGSEKLSQVLVLRMGDKLISNFRIKPNPAKNFINVSYFARKASPASFILVNADGVIVLKKKLNILAGDNSFQVTDLNKFPPGYYSALITTNTEMIRNEFLIVN